MSAVDRTTGEIIGVCTPDEARALTDRINQHADALWALLLEAHDRQAWKALGYETFSGYVTCEFNMHRRTAYKLLDQGRVIREISAVAGVPHGAHIDLTERQTRDIKPHLADVTDEIRERIDLADAEPPTEDEAKQIVCEIVGRRREQIERERERDHAIRELNERHQPPGFDPEENKERARLASRLIHLVETAADLPDAADVVGALRPNDRDYLRPLPRAIERLSAIREALEIAR